MSGCELFVARPGFARVLLCVVRDASCCLLGLSSFAGLRPRIVLGFLMFRNVVHRSVFSQLDDCLFQWAPSVPSSIGEDPQRVRHACR